MISADVDSDGDIDVLSTFSAADTIAWYEHDGSGSFTDRTISTRPDGPRSLWATDLDGDGDMDVVSASFFDDKIAWYEHDGSGSFVARTISTAADGAQSVITADFDGDGDTDVLSASINDDKIAWYRNVNAPQVASVNRDGGSETFDTFDTLAVTFDKGVNVTVASLTLVDETAGGTSVDLTGVMFGYNSSTFTAIWDFTGVAGIDAAFYTAILDATLVTGSQGGLELDGDGNGIGGDNFQHVVLVARRGDTDLDAKVDIGDFNTVASRFAPSGSGRDVVQRRFRRRRRHRYLELQ